MPDITVRNIDHEIIAVLKVQAKANHRSLEGEVHHILTQRALRSTRIEDFRERMVRLRSLTADLPQTDSVALIREDRDR